MKTKNINKDKKNKPTQKKHNKIPIIIIGLTIFFILIIAIGYNILPNNSTKNTDKKTNNKTENTNENLIYNTNEKVINDKIIGDISFSNINCSFDGNTSLLEYTITNNGKETINLGEYEIIIKDNKGNILANIAPTIDYELKPNESYETGNGIDIDLSNVYEIQLKLND